MPRSGHEVPFLLPPMRIYATARNYYGLPPVIRALCKIPHQSASFPALSYCGHSSLPFPELFSGSESAHKNKLVREEVN